MATDGRTPPPGRHCVATRIELKHWAYGPALRLYWRRSERAMAGAPGLVAASLLREGRGVYWTVSLWEGEGEARAGGGDDEHVRAARWAYRRGARRIWSMHCAVASAPEGSWADPSAGRVLGPDANPEGAAARRSNAGAGRG